TRASDVQAAREQRINSGAGYFKSPKGAPKMHNNHMGSTIEQICFRDQFTFS
ncbi:hypothetical protein BgiMline_006674, partial [Biomphalaria glabrata]